MGWGPGGPLGGCPFGSVSPHVSILEGLEEAVFVYVKMSPPRPGIGWAKRGSSDL